jgi:uncharacterized protein
MKYVLLLLVVMGLVFLSGVRKGRAGAAGASRRPGGPERDGRDAPHPSDSKRAALMVVCAECGTHLPQAEALPGRGGHFCSSEHRARFEAREHHG